MLTPNIESLPSYLRWTNSKMVADISQTLIQLARCKYLKGYRSNCSTRTICENLGILFTKKIIQDKHFDISTTLLINSKILAT